MTSSATAVQQQRHTGQPVEWITTIVRPVGPLNRTAAQHLRRYMVALGTVRGLVLVDLSAATPISAEGWRLLEDATRALDSIGGGLVVTGLTQQDRQRESSVTHYPADALPSRRQNPDRSLSQQPTRPAWSFEGEVAALREHA